MNAFKHIHYEVVDSFKLFLVPTVIRCAAPQDHILKGVEYVSRTILEL